MKYLPGKSTVLQSSIKIFIAEIGVFSRGFTRKESHYYTLNQCSKRITRMSLILF